VHQKSAKKKEKCQARAQYIFFFSKGIFFLPFFFFDVDVYGFEISSLLGIKVMKARSFTFCYTFIQKILQN
jgi:hypothetical protein